MTILILECALPNILQDLTYNETLTLTTNDLDEPTLTTPAISNGMIVLRTVKHLVGIGFESPATAPGG